MVLFEKEIFTLAQAARLAGMHRMAFQQELAKREIPVHYGIEELEEDMKNLGISFQFFLLWETGRRRPNPPKSLA